ncbi:MAG TPA: tryptophan--tRNA ligase [Solirubrobacteraceae bacterium]|nr:tryptophan--tRNA ligase [Solirubrobacteraceae bacterium]
MGTPTITLTGIQPTGELHLGNYAGAIRPLARLAAEPARETYVFVADLHALNRRPDPDQLRDRTRKMAAALLACGLDHDRVHVYRQSRVPAIAQISGLLSNVTSKGTLNRAHAYKALVAANAAAGRDTDHGINMGLFTYPVLMAADILAMRGEYVPVGADQAQHVEIAVELARAFARAYGPGALREPQAVVAQNGVLPGLDGRKMSKSHGNTIPLFAPPGRQAALIRRVVTDSRRPQDPKDPDRCTLVALLDAFAEPAVAEDVRARYRAGGIGYGDVKALLADRLETTLAPMRDRYQALLADPARLDAALRAGERHANRRAGETLLLVSEAMGLYAHRD